VFLAMTIQETPPREGSQIFKLQQAAAVLEDHGGIKVDQMGIVGCIPLRTADPVGIMADRTRGALSHDMFIVFPEALIIQNIVPVMTLVTEGIKIRTLRGVVTGFISPFQEMAPLRPMRAGRLLARGPWPGIVIMAVRAVNDAGRVIGRQQAGDIRVPPGPLHGVIRGIVQIELKTLVQLEDLPRDRRSALGAVCMTFETDFVLI